jgi:hypothetical protein
VQLLVGNIACSASSCHSEVLHVVQVMQLGTHRGLTSVASSYGLFKATDKKLLDSDDYLSRISTAENIAKE